MIKTTTITAIMMDLLQKMEFVFPTTDYAKPLEFKSEHTDDMRKVLNYLDTHKDIMIHDDHNGGSEIRKLQAVVVLATGQVCESFTTARHCLNPLYINEMYNNLHLSTLSCAGNIYPSETDANYYRYAIAEYNKGMLGWMPSKRIVAYKIF